MGEQVKTSFLGMMTDVSLERCRTFIEIEM